MQCAGIFPSTRTSLLCNAKNLARSLFPQNVESVVTFVRSIIFTSRTPFNIPSSMVTILFGIGSPWDIPNTANSSACHFRAHVDIYLLWRPVPYATCCSTLNKLNGSLADKPLDGSSSGRSTRYKYGWIVPYDIVSFKQYGFELECHLLFVQCT